MSHFHNINSAVSIYIISMARCKNNSMAKPASLLLIGVHCPLITIFYFFCVFAYYFKMEYTVKVILQ